MTVSELSKHNFLTALCMPEPDRVVRGGYTGDLLSWVMGRANTDDAWITIMSNSNTVAVASLADVSCVILSESVTLSEADLNTAKENGINVFSTPLTSFQVAAKIKELI